MAAITNSAFELRVSNHLFDTTKNITGKFQEGSPAADAVCAAGFLVVPGERLQNEGYASTVKNENAYIMGAAAATDEAIYACNTFNVQELAGPFGTVYKVGSNTLGLPIPAGERGTYTRIDEGDMIRFGIGNFTTAISTNGYATLGTSTNAGKLVPAASAPTTTGALYFEIVESGNFTQGAYAGFGYVLVKAHRVHTVAG
jgi:hypothetical protein